MFSNFHNFDLVIHKLISQKSVNNVSLRYFQQFVWVAQHGYVSIQAANWIYTKNLNIVKTVSE